MILCCNVLYVNILNPYFKPKEWCYVKSGDNHHNKKTLLSKYSSSVRKENFEHIIFLDGFPTKVGLFSWIWWAISYARHSESHSLLTAWSSFVSRQNIETLLFSTFIFDCYVFLCVFDDFDILVGPNYRFSQGFFDNLGHYAQFPGGVSKSWNFNLTVKLQKKFKIALKLH